MPHALTGHIKRKSTMRGLMPIFAARLVFAIHYFLILYTNSSFLGQFLPAESIGAIFTTGAAISVFAFLFISRILHKVGNFKLTVSLLAINFLVVLAMAFTTTAAIGIPLFVLLLIVQPLIYFNLDVFVESVTDNDVAATGSSRATLLTLGSIVAAVAPFVSAVFIDDTSSFTTTYILSALSLIPVAIIMFINFRHFSDPPYDEIDVLAAIRSFWLKRNIRLVFLAHFTLQLFFVFTVIYIPLYLTGTIGLSWTEFGITMFFAQLAYIITEYPAGYLADTYWGEKEMMAVGFGIIAVTLASFAFITSTSVVIWSFVMFITRLGAGLGEVTTEGYFFKKARSSDAQIISFFRLTGPLSMVVGTALVSLVLLYVPFNLVFIFGGFLMIPAMFFALNLKDTK